jgi:hypothetical protein
MPDQSNRAEWLPPGYRIGQWNGVYWPQREPHYVEHPKAKPKLTHHEYDALLLHKQRGIFSPGGRRRMNVIPMLANVFVPWTFFCICLTSMCFKLHHYREWMAWGIIIFCGVLWVASLVLAVWARKAEPDPMWYSFASLMIGASIVVGTIVGIFLYYDYFSPYYQINDLKVVANIDAGKEVGQDHMDAGLFYFAAGNKINTEKAWHFKNHDVYCVAPIVPKSGSPETGTYDFWAVGKNCCSTSASDFRCGAFDNVKARNGIRILDDQARPFYRLAVQQTESIYGIMATHPIFVEWRQDPLHTINGWQDVGYGKYLLWVAGWFVFCTFWVIMATWRFAWIGRRESATSKDTYVPPQAYNNDALYENPAAA